MSESPQLPPMPDLNKSFADAAAAFQKGLQAMGRTLSAQGAMGWAFQGNVTELEHALAKMTPETLTDLSAAAALLGSACDDELARRPE